MNFNLILLISSAYCAVVVKYENNDDYNLPSLIINEFEEVPDTHTTSIRNAVRIKRQVDLVKKSDDSYTINAKKDIINDGTKKLTTYGIIDDIKLGNDGYSSLNAGVDFKNAKGNELSISGLHTKTEDKLSGKGLLNIVNTDTQSLTAKGFAEKTWKDDNTQKKIAGILDYLNKNGNKLSLSGLHTKTEDKLIGEGHLNLLNTDTQSLTAKGFGEKSWKNDDTLTKYGGSLNYLNKIGNDAILSAKHDSSLGDAISARGTYSLINTDDQKWNAKAYWNKEMPINKPPIESYGGSLNYLNSRKGNSASILAQHIPDLGDQLSLAGKYNILHNDNHDLHASGQITRTFPFNRNIGNYNDFSGNLDYLYKDRVGLDLGVKHSGLSQRSDFSAMGNLNLFRDRNTNFDLFGGVTKSISPNFNSPWGSSFGLQFQKTF